jgi:hypothetical protein
MTALTSFLFLTNIFTVVCGCVVMGFLSHPLYESAALLHFFERELVFLSILCAPKVLGAIPV